MPNLPKPPQFFETELRRYLDNLVHEIEFQLDQLDRAYGRDYTLQNVPTTGSKTLDANSSDLDTTRKVLARLMDDLQRKGKLTHAKS